MRTTALILGALASAAVLAGCGTTATSGTDGQSPGTSVPTDATTSSAEPTTTAAPPPTTVAPVATRPATTRAAAPTTHAAPTAHAAPPPAAVSTSCTARMTDAQPGDGGSDTVVVHTTAGATVMTTDHYKTKPTEHDGTADSTGTAAITFGIGRPTRGYTVQVDVMTSSGQSCSTEFTPQ